MLCHVEREREQRLSNLYGLDKKTHGREGRGKKRRKEKKVKNRKKEKKKKETKKERKKKN
jgi:hypothetical protein